MGQLTLACRGVAADNVEALARRWRARMLQHIPKEVA
jgi:hypothetical protein